MDVLLVLNSLAHDLGIAFGLGGATIAFIISKRANKNQKSAPVLMLLIESISRIIWLGLLLLIFSGIGLMFTVSWPMNGTLLVVKHVLVALIVVNGIYLGKNSKRLGSMISRREEELNATKRKVKNIDKVNDKDETETARLKRRLGRVSSFNLFLWYVVMLLSVIL